MDTDPPPIDVLASHSGKSDRREWHTVGAWLQPGERIVIVRADDDALDEPEQCECHRCIREHSLTANGLPLSLTKMIVCPTCGNKRCPKASDHRLACTGSNEPGQPGSVYAVPAEPEPPNQSEEALDMVKARQIAREYGRPDSGIDSGNLFWALHVALRCVDQFALAEPEPVAWQCREHGDGEWVECSKEAYGINPRRYEYRRLYTTPPASPSLTPAQEHADDLLDALKALLHDPTGCAFCDSGTLRIRVVTGKLCQHDEQCGFVKARAAIKMVEEARPCA